MSKKTYVVAIQPNPPDGPVFGRVSDPTEFQTAQNFAHAHIETVTKDLLMTGALTPLVSGFTYGLSGGLKLTIQVGHVFDLDGFYYESEVTEVTHNAAHATLPRVDLVYALLEKDAPAKSEYRPFRQLRTQAELEAGVPDYTPTQVNTPTELHTRATVAVRAGVPDANPVAPAPNANEVPLYYVRVNAAAVALIAGNVTDARNLLRSFLQLLTDYVKKAGDTMTGGLRVPSLGVNIAPDAAVKALKAATADAGEAVMLDFANGGNSRFQLSVQQDAGQNACITYFKTSRGGTFATALLIDSFQGCQIPLSLLVGANLSVTGSLSKGSGTFLIDHPLDPANKDLIHGFIESPRYDLLYRGRVKLSKGRALVNLDEASNMTAGTFALLVRDPDVWLQNKSGFTRLRYELTGAQLEIIAEDEASEDDVSWQVVGERKDPFIMHSEGTDSEGHLIVEREKEAADDALLSERIETVESDTPADDVEREEVAVELIGKRGFPRHAQTTGVGAIPKRRIITRTVVKGAAEA